MNFLLISFKITNNFTVTKLYKKFKVVFVYIICIFSLNANIYAKINASHFSDSRFKIFAEDSFPCKFYNIHSDTITSSTTYLQSNEFLEYSKIILMCTLSSVFYGIIHDLITTQINFDYFASYRNHHGHYTEENFPFIYKSQSKILYALLWGTIATWGVGLPLGLLWAIAARYGSHNEKLNWKDLIKLDILFIGGLLTTSLTIGFCNYLFSQDSYNMVATMHETSYIIGVLGGLITSICIFAIRKPIEYRSNEIVNFEPTGICINLVGLFNKSPNKKRTCSK